MRKIYKDSIDLLQRTEKLALQYSDKGFYLAFSGGKDSQCLYHIAKLAGVKFEAHYAHTGIDHPELVRFVRTNYPEVISDYPNTTFWRLCLKKKMLPTRFARYCCEVLKETKGAGTVTLTGVRRTESVKRSHRKMYEVSNHKFSSDSESSFEMWRKEQRDKNNDQFTEQGETLVRCVNGKDKIIINPILNWKDADVWYFLDHVVHVKHCELYDRGYHRLGCLFCPMANIKELRKMERDYPKYKDAYIRTIHRLRNMGIYNNFDGFTDEEVFQWWLSSERSDRWIYDRKYQLQLVFED